MKKKKIKSSRKSMQKRGKTEKRFKLKVLKRWQKGPGKK
jgi:hypothetical protein